MDLAPANQELSIVDKLFYGRPSYEFFLKNRLEATDDGYYDAILIDCPPSMGTLLLNALTAAELLIIPTQCEYYASRSLRDVLKLVELMRKKTNPTLAYRVLITMFDRRTILAKQVREEIIGVFGDHVFDTFITKTVRLEESPAHRASIFEHAPSSSGAYEYYRLCEEVLERVGSRQ